MDSIWNRVNQNIDEILSKYRHIAVVGMSRKSFKPSHYVAMHLKHAGYRIYPVNPAYDSILDMPCYPSLKDVPHPIEIVDIFRRSEDVLPVVEEAIAVGAKVIWMQSGIVNEQAAQLALEAGLDVVMDRCMKSEHMSRMF